MSTDDIVFDEIQYREPRKARRPDRNPKQATIAHGIPTPGDLPIFLHRKAADQIERHALRDVSVELGGILLGIECVDDQTGEPFVWITESLEAKHYESSEARFKYTHESWEEITRERDQLHPDLDIVGWYHTHPDFGIFLSGLDLFIHENYFNQPLQVAYVVDPIRQVRGFFQWRNGRMESQPIHGFHLSADRAERLALARLVNDLEQIPNPEGGGSGGISPRLEAELIAMLSRPSYAPAASTYDQARASAFQTMLGVLLGATALGAVLWINSLTGQVRDQSGRIDELTKAVKDTTDMQRLALDTLIQRAEKSGEGAPSVSIVESYKKALDARDKLKLDAENRAYINDQLASENRSIRADNFTYKTKLAAAETLAKKNEEAAKQAKILSEDLAKAQDQVDRQNGTISAKSELLKEFDVDGGLGLMKKYQWSWWSAVVGWVVAGLSLLGLVALWAYLNPVKDESQIEIPPRPIVVNLPPNAAPSSPSADSDPPHVIS